MFEGCSLAKLASGPSEGVLEPFITTDCIVAVRPASASCLLSKRDGQPTTMTTNQNSDSQQLEQSLIDIAVESWRFAKLFGRVLGKLDAGEGSRYVNQVRYFDKKVEESLAASGLKLVNVEGQAFDPGIAASALNLGDFAPDDLLFVDQMVEPIIMGPDGIKRQGTIMLKKGNA